MSRHHLGRCLVAKDDLDPARGALFGVSLGAIIWLVIGVLVVLALW